MDKIIEKHVIKNLTQGGFVLVLNNEAKIDGQAEAMLQGLHSRSVGGIKHHLKILEKKVFEETNTSLVKEIMIKKRNIVIMKHMLLPQISVMRLIETQMNEMFK